MRSGGSLAVVLACAALSLAACSSIENPTSVDVLGEAPYAPAQDYAISPGDEIEVRFFHTPELNVTLPVRPDGKISVPFAHEIDAAGRSPDEIRDELTVRYERELERPRYLEGYQ